MQFRVLGPLRATSDAGTEIPLGGPKQRAVLALLISSPGRSIETDRLIDELWPDEASASNRKTVQAYVSRLRAAFAEHGAPDAIRPRANGYHLDDAHATDAAEFEAALTRSRAMVHSQPEEAFTLAGGALGLWQGLPFEDAYPAPRLEIEAARLEELRLAAYEAWAEAGLAAGQNQEIVPDLRLIADANPFRERLWELLMLSLYRSGRQAEALNTYVEVARRLREELGVEPAAELADLQRRMLQQDPTLAAPRPVPGRIQVSKPADARRTRGPVLAGAIVVLATILMAIVLLRPQGQVGASPSTAERYSLPTGATEVAASQGRLWVLDPTSATVTVIDTSAGRVTTRTMPGRPSAIAGGLGAIWMASEEQGAIWKIDPTSGATLGRSEGLDLRGSRLAVGTDAVWVVREQAIPFLGVSAADLEAQPVTFVDAFGGPTQPDLAVAEGRLWASNSLVGEVMSIDPVTGGFRFAGDARISDHPVRSILADRDAVWISQPTNGSVSRLDLAEGSAVRTVHLGDPTGRGFGRVVDPYGMAAGPGGIWVTLPRDHKVALLDDGSAEVLAEIGFQRPVSVTAAAASVWVLDAGSHELVRVRPGSCATLPIIGPGSDLRGCDLSEKAPIGADLTGADLRWADLRFALLERVDLTDADLYGADLTGAALDGITWDSTRCPDGTVSDQHGDRCPRQ
jgi:DNA-binding SARP family transcriptional activator